MSHLDDLENQSVYILREAYKHFKELCMLWSIPALRGQPAVHAFKQLRG